MDVIPDKWKQQEVAHQEEIDAFLAHYGIPGMRWGVIHDVDASGHADRSSRDLDKAKVTQAKRDAKAGKYEEQAKGYEAQIAQVKAQTPRSAIGRRSQQATIRDLEGYRDQSLKAAEAKRQGKLTDTQKKVIIGASVAAAVIVGAVVYNNAQNGNFTRLASKGAQLVNGEKGLPFKKNEALAKASDPDSVFNMITKKVNPGFGKPGTKVNCRRCTFAYEMSRRGYEVQATRTTNGRGQNAQGLLNALTPGMNKSTSKSAALLSIFTNKEGSKLDTIATKEGLTAFAPQFKIGKQTVVRPGDLYDLVAKQPEGSRGELSVGWLGGGRHSMAYEIFAGGKAVIFDNQTGEKFDSFDRVKEGIGNLASAGITRLDNVELNEDFLRRWVTGAK